MDDNAAHCGFHFFSLNSSIKC